MVGGRRFRVEVDEFASWVTENAPLLVLSSERVCARACFVEGVSGFVRKYTEARISVGGMVEAKVGTAPAVRVKLPSCVVQLLSVLRERNRRSLLPGTKLKKVSTQKNEACTSYQVQRQHNNPTHNAYAFRKEQSHRSTITHHTP